jgi:signal transduction histidine kinase
LVEAHGGHVAARSEGGGATFTVRLPLTGAESGPSDSRRDNLGLHI